MNKREHNRQTIFSIYVDNLNFLVENKFVDERRNIYLCPICLEAHENLNQDNPLTLEDAPPKSLGGKPIILTCKKCNNTCGYEIDSHLTHRLRDLDKLKFLPNSSAEIKIQLDGHTIRGKLNTDQDNKQNLTFGLKNNNPKVLHEIMSNAVGKPVEPYFIPGKVNEENLQFALLKTAYLMAFARFGYSLILDTSYDIVRQQILNPNKRIYPNNFWMTNFPYEICDSYIVCNKGVESVISIFELNTGISQTRFAVILPTPKTNIHDALEILNQSTKEQPIMFELFPKEKINFLTEKAIIDDLYQKIR
jgi:hypothetical protein